MSVVKNGKRRYSERSWVKSNNIIYKTIIYDKYDVNECLKATSGYKERQRKIWRDISKRRRGLLND